jgi:hypothetical protein
MAAYYATTATYYNSNQTSTCGSFNDYSSYPGYAVKTYSTLDGSSTASPELAEMQSTPTVSGSRYVPPVTPKNARAVVAPAALRDDKQVRRVLRPFESKPDFRPVRSGQSVFNSIACRRRDIRRSQHG